MPILLHRKNFKHLLMPICLSLFVTSCSNLMEISPPSLLQQDANASSDYYIRHIKQAQNLEEQQDYKLLAARVLIKENKIAQAKAMLASLQELNEEQNIDKILTSAYLASVEHQDNQANSLLSSLDFAKLNVAQQIRFYRVKAAIAKDNNDLLAAINEHTKIDALLNDVQKKQRNNDQTWALLQQANPDLINAADAYTNDPILKGWLDLAKTYHNNINNPTNLRTSLQNWKLAHPNHVATYLFPQDLQRIFNFQHINVDRVALILPLSGRAQLIGKTVKQGFESQAGQYIPIQTFDSASMPISQIMQDIKMQGFTNVVGPLLKQNVNQLQAHPEWTEGLNIIALNTTPNIYSSPNLCYYSLSPEDEAVAAANEMWKNNITQPMVLMPQNSLGHRVANAFNARWQQLANTDANIQYYTQANNVLPILEAGLQNQIQAVYTLGNNDQLASIKTAVDNTNSSLKVYTSSRINSPNNLPAYRMLMNNVKFSDIPLFKEHENDEFKKIAQANRQDYSLMRLYAMGEDAWQLINHFNELRQIPGFSIDGLTGKIHASNYCNMKREMTWFTFNNGNVELLQEGSNLSKEETTPTNSPDQTIEIEQ